MYLCICFFILCISCWNGKVEGLATCAAVANVFDPTVSPIVSSYSENDEAYDSNENGRLLYGIFDRYLASTETTLEPCCIPWGTEYPSSYDSNDYESTDTYEDNYD